MGSELVGSSSSQENDRGSENTTPFISFTKVFEKHFPFYLSIGMTYDQYWNEDCWLTKAYFEAYKLKQERELSYDNYKAWLQGLYFYEALCDVSPILHAFAPKGTKARPYKNKPYPITEQERKEHEEEARQKRLELFRQRLLASVN